MSSMDLLTSLSTSDEFIGRHIGPNASDVNTMLSHLNLSSVAELISQTVPDDIRLPQAMDFADAKSEAANAD